MIYAVYQKKKNDLCHAFEREIIISACPSMCHFTTMIACPSIYAVYHNFSLASISYKIFETPLGPWVFFFFFFFFICRSPFDSNISPSLIMNNQFFFREKRKEKESPICGSNSAHFIQIFFSPCIFQKESDSTRPLASMIQCW